MIKANWKPLGGETYSQWDPLENVYSQVMIYQPILLELKYSIRKLEALFLKCISFEYAAEMFQRCLNNDIESARHRF